MDLMAFTAHDSVESRSSPECFNMEKFSVSTQVSQKSIFMLQKTYEFLPTLTKNLKNI